MIIPSAAGLTSLPEHDREIFQENRMFGMQWSGKRPTERTTIEVLANGTLASFTAAIKQAANQARGREVILLTGHGAIGVLSSLAQSAFDTVPEPDLMVKHKHVITAEVVNLDQTAEKKNGKWISKEVKRGNVIVKESQTEIDKLAPRRDMLEDIGQSMKAGGVRGFRLLTCNVGNDTAFIDKLAKILGVEVIAYKNFTITQECTFENPKTVLVQLYVGPRPNNSVSPPINPPPKVSGPNDPQFTEIPHNDEAKGNP